MVLFNQVQEVVLVYANKEKKKEKEKTNKQKKTTTICLGGDPSSKIE